MARSAWINNTLILPFYAALASLLNLVLIVFWESRLGRQYRESLLKSPPSESENESLNRASESLTLNDHIRQLGGRRILAFNVARLIGCLVLVGISAAAAVMDGPEEVLDIHKFSQLTLCGVFFYSACLAILSFISPLKWRRLAVKHLNVVLFTTFAVYFYRDIFPMVTNPLVPLDLWEGQLLWPKIGILFGVAVLIPISIPRQYRPVDPEKPMAVANAEQTASIFSTALYFFLDPIISLAYRIPHLSFDQLPPLCDYDEARHLKAKHFSHLDPFLSTQKRHVAFGFLWIFRWEFLTMTILLTIEGLCNFVSPLAINRVLSYLEDPHNETFMKPWFWVLLLFIGPLTSSIAFQWDMFVATRMMTQSSALVTQLVFEHALRIRVKAETTPSGKGEAASETPDTPSAEKASANMAGKINTLVTVDLANIAELRNVLFLFVLVPVQIIGSVVFLYRVLGWSAFLGMGAMLALSPLPGYLANMQSTIQRKALDSTEARVQAVSETMSVLRMIKMFGWEKQVQDRIEVKRQEELNWIWWRKIAYTASMIANSLLPTVTMLTLIMKEDLSPAKVFSSMAVFDVLRAQIWFTMYSVSLTVKGKVSLDRLNNFLRNTELLDAFSAEENTDTDASTSDLIGFRDAMFTWCNDDQPDGSLTPSSRKFVLKIEGELFFKQGFNLIVGPTGSGKTSLLMALLGEMHMIPSSPASWYNLPRAQGVSFASQESWVLNDTIKNNILFNAPLDEQRYKKVLHQCCLERDLELFDGGDECEVGERVVVHTDSIASGGQKARVTLARAVYADTRVLILDDILAALDVHTAKWIVEKCLAGDLLQGRTVILVTHNIALTSKLADFVVSVGLDGRVHGRDSISDALAKDEVLTKEINDEAGVIETAIEELKFDTSADEPKKPDGKLIVAEEIEIGHVSWDALSMFFSAHASGNILLFYTGLIATMIFTSSLDRFETWYMAYWAGYLGGFSLLVTINIVINCASYAFFALGSFNASKVLHKQLLASIVGTTFRWLDVTPVSRIIARFTADVDAIDDSLSECFLDFLGCALSLWIRLFAIVIFAPVFFIPGVLVGIAGIACGRIYMASQMSVKREQSNAKSPVLAHIGAAIGGLSSVRAYGAQNTLIQISIDRINRLTRASRTFANLNRWVTVRIGLLSAIFTTSLAYYLVYLQNQRASNIGFTLTTALGFTSTIMTFVHMWNRFEVQSNSLERVKQYIEIEQEPKARSDGVPPAYWPASGNITVENLSARYSPDGPEVLHNISFSIKSGERVGIVGRTGSGKSSLTLALLRCIYTEGTVYYDGIPTSSINLDVLRRNVTIIPQVPELVAGSLRSNLDTLGEMDDAFLIDALRSAGLSALQDDMEEGKLTLDSEISAGGSNLSVGQRQIIALGEPFQIIITVQLIPCEARAIVHYKTDAVIQASLRTELPRDTTCLIVAHRLQSVLDADKIVEFDSPKVLLKNEHGMLRALVDESGDKELLYQMAQAS
ncbi:ATP-binding cassette transporter [Favolaschia claudopus]|uniref:ATP-binding cassette transporter n=1 Tax=Favolaschia claudopus TaxID=2862362 RepID=A0AAW0DB87_9AGAR